MGRLLYNGFSVLFSLLFVLLFVRYAFSSSLFLVGSVLLLGILGLVLLSLCSTQRSSSYSIFASVLMFVSVLYLHFSGQSFSYALLVLALCHFVLSLKAGTCSSYSCSSECSDSESFQKGSVPSHSVVFSTSSDSSSYEVSKDLEGKQTVSLDQKEVLDSDSDTDDVEVVKTTVKKPSKKKRSSSSLFVASKNGKYYHKVGSEWAEKIKEENRVLFSSQEEAQDAGYRPSADLKK